MIKHENITVIQCPTRTIETQQMTITDEKTGAEELYQLEVHKPEGDDGSNWKYVAFLILPDGTTEELEDDVLWAHGLAWQKENIAPDEKQMEFWE
tara:strand:+ start:198 stop:482 length:285 start_codon:yes stop_codon:yes gene_type:complete